MAGKTGIFCLVVEVMYACDAALFASRVAGLSNRMEMMMA
jgi:hypothetical protein